MSVYTSCENGFIVSFIPLYINAVIVYRKQAKKNRGKRGNCEPDANLFWWWAERANSYKNEMKFVCLNGEIHAMLCYNKIESDYYGQK